MNTRTRIRPAIVILATATAITAVSVTDAHGATPATQVYSGYGWKIRAPKITHLDTKPWTIAFHNTTARTKLTPYAKVTAAELKKHTGLAFTVTTTIKPYTSGTCASSHTIVLKYDTTAASSYAKYCHLGHAPYSGAAIISAKTWNAWHSMPIEAYRKNVVSHETAHVLGLDHPNTCPGSPMPLMCGEKWGGYKTTSLAGRYAPQDINGLKNLVANRTKVPPITAP